MSIIEKNTLKIKNEATRLGFLNCGISKADFLENEAPFFEKWLQKGMHGNMKSMENNFDKRMNPKLLVENAKSVISLLFNYYPEKSQIENSYKIAKYAYGNDYHYVIKHKLKDLLKFIKAEIGEVNGRVFIDSAPVADKVWAAKSGLGWIGKNSNLITKQVGSFYFIAEIILDLDLMHDPPTTDHCGSCTACIDACPTQAIVAPYVVEGTKCISYFTIELKDQLPQEMKGKFDDWIFGCDICQDVCPWNKFAKPHQEPYFETHPEKLHFTKNDWQEITEETFKKVFKNSAVKRTNFEGLTRNIKFLGEG